MRRSGPRGARRGVTPKTRRDRLLRMRKTPMNKPHHDISPLLTAKDVAARLKVSLSWLAKARMRGDGLRQPDAPGGARARLAHRAPQIACSQWMLNRVRA